MNSSMNSSRDRKENLTPEQKRLYLRIGLAVLLLSFFLLLHDGIRSYKQIFRSRSDFTDFAGRQINTDLNVFELFLSTLSNQIEAAQELAKENESSGDEMIEDSIRRFFSRKNFNRYSRVKVIFFDFGTRIKKTFSYQDKGDTLISYTNNFSANDFASEDQNNHFETHATDFQEESTLFFREKDRTLNLFHHYPGERGDIQVVIPLENLISKETYLKFRREMPEGKKQILSERKMNEILSGLFFFYPGGKYLLKSFSPKAPLGRKENFFTELNSWRKTLILSRETFSWADWRENIYLATAKIENFPFYVGYSEKISEILIREFFLRELIKIFLFVSGFSLLYLYFERKLIKPVRSVNTVLKTITRKEEFSRRFEPSREYTWIYSLQNNLSGFFDFIFKLLNSIRDEVRKSKNTRLNLLNAYQIFQKKLETSLKELRNLRENQSKTKSRLEGAEQSVNEMYDQLKELSADHTGSAGPAGPDPLRDEASDSSRLRHFLSRIKALSELSGAETPDFRELLRQNKEHLQKTLREMKEFRSRSKSIALTSEELSAIAEQMKLLSINISIESGHRGESGRGLSVIADTMKRLAETAAFNTQKLAGDIRTVLSYLEKIKEPELFSGDNYNRLQAAGKQLETYRRSTEELLQILPAAREETARRFRLIREYKKSKQEELALLTESGQKILKMFRSILELSAQEKNLGDRVDAELLGIDELQKKMVLHFRTIVDNFENLDKKFDRLNLPKG